MKLLIVAGVNGRFDLLSPLLDRFEHCISIGDFNLFSPLTDVNEFCANKHVEEGKRSQHSLEKFSTNSKIYHIYGSRDDPFTGSFSYFHQKGISFAGALMSLFGQTFHTLGGYYNYTPPKKDEWDVNDPPKSRLLLRESGIELIGYMLELAKKKKEKRILISYEPPAGYPFLGRGCPQLNSLIEHVDFWIYGHHDILSITNKIIGIPNLNRCYCVLDTKNLRFEIWHRFTEEEDYSLYTAINMGDQGD